MKQWVIDNWELISVILGIALAIVIVVAVPKKWLLWAVMQAETELGGGTGQLKLMKVYDMFIQRFPWISKLMPFLLFSILVDKALDEMRNILEKNQEIAGIVEMRSTI